MFAEVYVACRHRRGPETIRGKWYVFVYVPEHRFFGFEETRVLEHLVQMATLERALLDAIDRPRYAGGIGEVSRIAATAATRVSWDSLLHLARRWGSSALVQRWNVVENVPPKVLIPKGEKPRRRVVLQGTQRKR